MLQNVELTLDLFRIYLRDETEKANIDAINAITHAFDAVAGVIFYENSDKKYVFCLSGTAFPIELPESRWRSCVENHTGKENASQFTGWSPPGIDTPVAYWISASILTSEKVNGYIFLGKNNELWNSDEIHAFGSVTDVITEIVLIRNQKNFEAKSRSKAEENLKKNERRMSVFFETFHDMIYTTDTEDHFTSINGAGLKLFGLKSRDQIIGKSFADFAVNSDVHDFFLQKIHKEGYIDDHEIVLKHSDGSTIYCLETSHAVKAQDGTIIEIQGLIKDISERIENERALWKMNLELSELNMKLQQTQDLMIQQEKLASIGQLSAGIAHEINNPLGFLMSNQSMLRNYFTTIDSVYSKVKILNDPRFHSLIKQNDLEYIFEELPRIFDESDDGFARIMRIVSNLKSFSRVDLDTNLEIFDVNAGLESTLTVAWNEIKYVADVTKKFDDLPKIYARGGEINQVILNILVNAAQAIEEQKRSDKGHIHIETRLEGASVVILISDDGPGIPQHLLSKIFDPFFTTKEPGKGTGLGLSISYDIIVSKHKGKLTVESEKGKGTLFRIELPIAPMDE